MKKLLLVLFVGLIISGCSPKFYTPNTQNVPLMQTKGQTNLTVAGNTNQVEFQAAYAAGNHVAVQANGGLFIPDDLDNGNGGSGKFVEGGLGYFTLVGENFVFETYGLLGGGSFENHMPSTVNENNSSNGNISAAVLRYGVQPNFGFVTKYFSAALSGRLVSLNYSNISGNLVFEDVDQSVYLSENKSSMLIEPAITLRAGVEKFKAQLQFGSSYNLTNSNFRQDKAYLTLGLNFNFGR